MKTILTSLILFFIVNLSSAQIFGSNDVCPAYRYSYSATIVGAAIYQWNFPPGWYNITGQGTGTVTVTCNENYGDIYCEGIDAAGNSIATLVLVTQFGGGAAVGWDVQPQNNSVCLGDPYALNIVPNGSGGGSCANSCGNGIAITNIAYAVYDDVWPFGSFVGFANGNSLPVPAIPGSYSYYIYNVDYTNGTNTSQAVRIDGGCGTASVNNIAQLNIPIPNYPGYTQMPNPVCIGDTVTVWSTGGGFGPIMGVTALPGGDWIVTSMPARLSHSGIDNNGCPFSEICYINTTTCAPAFLTGDSVLCNGNSYNYTAFIPGALTYDWMIPLAWTNVSGQGTSTITATCYGGNAWISVLGHDALGNIVGAKDLFTQIGTPAFCTSGSISGDSTVCSGYIYNYSATISGAVSYVWTFPSGWYSITGQGTSNVSATCNVNDGYICVEGFDTGGNSVGTECIATQFGGGGAGGWDVQPAAVSGCANVSFTVGIMPNGTGGGSGCPSGCGSGILHPNIVYGLYSNVWPTGYFLGYADGVSSMFFGPFAGPAYVYKVDISAGTNPPQAIKIDGGCGSGSVNNVCTINSFLPNPPVVMQLPMPACIGDTVQLSEVSGLQNIGWGFVNTADLNFLSSQLSNPLLAIVTGNNPATDVTGTDFNGCISYDPYVQVAVGNCAVPNIQFSSSDTVFCDKQSINFNDLSSNAPTSWKWTFNGATPSTSLLKNPQNIYYPTNGTFDVKLVACNTVGCDSITLTNFITEHISPTPTIYLANDTLYVTAANSYQWYEVDSGLISGATNQFFMPTQAGNYYCIIVDSVGCSGASISIAITTGILSIAGNWQLAIVPNPNDGNFQFEFVSNSKMKNIKTQIVNVLGEIVFENEIENVSGKFSEQINLTNQPKGVYYLKIISAEKTFSGKIIVR